MAFVYTKGCSPFHERKAHATEYEKRADAKAKICLTCTKDRCDDGACELIGRRKKSKKCKTDKTD